MAGASAVVCAAAGWGCASAPDRAAAAQVAAGDMGEARRLAYQRVQRGDGDERALDLMRLLFVTTADGYAPSAEVVANELFDLLRRQGLNADRTLASAVVNEDVKRWKGEPFEQAMAYAEISAQKASVGDWGNARAAASASLFLLKSFGEAGLSDEELAERAAARAREGEEDYLDHGYQPVETDFALGYAMHGIASLAMGRDQEASDNLRKAVEHVPAWKPAADRILARDFDTVLIVQFGLGPEKVLTGPDGAVAEWRPRTMSSAAAAAVRVGEGPTETFAWVEDVNRMSADHRWGGMEDVRNLKSILGQGLMLAGTGVAIAGEGDAKYVGLGMVLAGLIARAGAHADPRFCEVLPQRTYLVPIRVGSEGAPVSVQVEGVAGSRLEIPWMQGPGDAPFSVRVVRVLDAPAPPPWAVAGAMRYNHDGYPGRVPGDGLPWILGGMCVSVPSHETLVRYQAAGNLRGMTTADLAELYRLEGITWDLEALGGIPRGHVLEGGTTLVAPQEGTAGAVRLFAGGHPPYAPKSNEVRDVAEKIRLQNADAVASGENGE